jgi:hypothetical protein
VRGAGQLWYRRGWLWPFFAIPIHWKGHVLSLAEGLFLLLYFIKFEWVLQVLPIWAALVLPFGVVAGSIGIATLKSVPAANHPTGTVSHNNQRGD